MFRISQSEKLVSQTRTTAHWKVQMVRRLFSKLFTTKQQRFDDNLNHEGRHGTILEVDQDREWFVFLADHKIEDFREFGGPVLVLFQKQRSSPIARMRLVIHPKKSELFIGDFESDIENKGYSSILLRNVIKLAEMIGLKRITGNLAAVDSDHFDKLKYLYSKYGFKVYISGSSRRIILNLDSCN